MRFRPRRIGIVANIEKAFLQIGLQAKERDATRFVWLKDKKKLPTPDNSLTYCFTRVSFGSIASSFLLRAKIKHYLEKEVRRILKDINIDNLITDAESKEKGHHMYTISKKKFKKILTNMRE